MKYILSLAMIFAFGVVTAQKKADTVKIKTSAVCEMCQYTIERDLTYEKGVKDSHLDVASAMLLVVYDPKKTNPSTIRKRVTKIGYNADDLKRDPKAYEQLPACCKDGAHGKDHDMDHEHHKK